MAKIINGSSLALALANYLCTNAYLNDTAQDVLIMVGNWIDEAPEITVPLWIPVSERLPEREELVLIICKNGARFVGFYNCFHNGISWGIKTALDSVRWLNKGRVTHWMPLPEPPTEE